MNFKKCCLGLMLVCVMSAGAAEIEKRYQDAIEDALVIEPWEIKRDLVAITPWNEHLERRGDGFIKVVTFLPEWVVRDVYRAKLTSLIGFSFAQRHVQHVTLAVDAWVTTVPELRNFCQAKKWKNETQLLVRVKQLLGLSLRSENKYVAELWVDPAHLVRPCIDNEVIDSQCVPDVVAHMGKNVKPDLKGGDPAWQRWFEQTKRANYESPSPEKRFPWTRLGYSYDWGRIKKSFEEIPAGLSEFVVPKGITVDVAGIYSLKTYCNAAALQAVQLKTAAGSGLLVKLNPLRFQIESLG